MSLIAWWPLNGNTNNNGTLGAELQATASNTTFVDGKIGEALYKGSLTITSEQWKKIIGNTISIAMWIYTREDGTYSAGTPFFGYGGMTKPNNRKFTMFHYPAKTTLHCSWQNDDLDSTDKPNTYLSITYANFFEIGKWVHLCVVQDAATETVTIYRNGTQYSKTNISGLATMNFKSAAAAPIRNNIDYQHTNDLRIYDHALSKAEVKELSKGLMLHYSFDDPYQENSNNIGPRNKWSVYSSYWAIQETTDTGWKIKFVDNANKTGTVALSASFYQDIAIGDIVTFSCYLYKDGKPFKSKINTIGTYGLNYKSPMINTEQRDDGYFTCTFEVTKVNNSFIVHSELFGGYNTVDRDAIYEIRDIQFEKNDHATPYTPGEHETDRIIDESGYGYDGKQTDLTFSLDTPSGSHSVVFNGDTSCIDVPFIKKNLWKDAHTCSIWIKFNEDGEGQNLRSVIYGDYSLNNTSNGLNVEKTASHALRYYHLGNPDFYSNFYFNNEEWYMLTVTYDPQATEEQGRVKMYINGGESIIAITGDKDKEITWENIGGFRIGRDARSGDTALKGSVADFKMYATTLSKEDIEKLYKTKLSIDSKQNCVVGEIIEDKIPNMVSVTDWEQGGIIDQEGTDSDNMNNRLRTKFLPVLPNTTYTCSVENGYDVRGVHYYDSNNLWLGSNLPVIDVLTFTTPETCKYVRWVIQDDEPSNEILLENLALCWPTMVGENFNIPSSLATIFNGPIIQKAYKIKAKDICEGHAIGLYKDGNITAQTFIER